MLDSLNDEATNKLIRTGTVPPRMDVLLEADGVLDPLKYRQILAACAAGDQRDFYTYLGYDRIRLNSAFAAEPYPLEMNPFSPTTLKPEKWLAARLQESSAAIEELYSQWFATMPDHLAESTLQPNLKVLVHHANYPLVDSNNVIGRLNELTEANYLYHHGDRMPTAWLLNTEEEAAAERIYNLYTLETKKMPPNESPSADKFFVADFFPNLFRHAKAFDIWRELRRTCGLTDESVAVTWPKLYNNPKESLGEN